MQESDLSTLDPSVFTTNPLELIGISPTEILLFFAASAFVSVLFIGLMLLNVARNWRMQKAIFQLQKDVHEMNERAKQPKIAEKPPEPTSNEAS